MFRALAAILLLAAPAQVQPKYKLETADAKAVTATVTYELNTTNFAVSKWMTFLPEPPELPSQTKVKTTAIPVGKVVSEKSLLARKVRYVEVSVAKPKAGSGLTLKFDVEAVLRSRKLVPLQPDEKPPNVAELTAAERKYYLSSTTQVDHAAKAFGEWLDAKKLRRTADEDEIAFAVRVVDALRADYRYRFDAALDKRASAVCRTDSADCAGLSYLLVGAMRANGIPARALVGRMAESRAPGSNPAQLEYDRPHIRAELYVPGVGWVPADPAFAVTGGRRRPSSAFVGFDSGDLLVFHIDTDLLLPFPDKAREAQVLQVGPVFWTEGRGTFDATFGPTGWELKAAPAKK